MTELKNQFRWSKSRAATFSDCKRKYYLRYYQHWGGWEKDAPEINRIAYRLGKMVSMDTLVGSAVHEVLANHFRALRNGQLRELKPERPVEKMREVWRNAKKELWRSNPKRFPPLFEIYYQRIPPDEKLKKDAEKARRSIRNLKELPLYRSLREINHSDFLWVDPAAEKFSEETYFTVLPYEAIASPDLVYREGDRMVIVDWKTGKEREDDRLQMGAAGLWARQRLPIEGNELKAVLVYLKTSSVLEFKLDEKITLQSEETIRQGMEAMSQYLKDPGRNIPLEIESFPLHNNRKFCWHCEFQEICFKNFPGENF